MHVDLWAHMMHITTPPTSHLMCPRVSTQNICWNLKLALRQLPGTTSPDILQTIRLQQVALLAKIIAGTQKVGGVLTPTCNFIL